MSWRPRRSKRSGALPALLFFRKLCVAEALDDEGNPFGIDHIRACVQPKTEGRRTSGAGVGEQPGLDRRRCAGPSHMDFHRFQKPWGETVKEIEQLTGTAVLVEVLVLWDAKPRNPTINGCSESKAVAHNNS